MKTIYTYKNCSREELEKNIDFKEELFDEKLAKLESSSILVERVDVTFEMGGHHDFHCRIEAHIPGENIMVKEEGKGVEPVITVHKAINTAIESFRRHKEKVKSH
jgi:ribosome-associated translation inhibitor RaiA